VSRYGEQSERRVDDSVSLEDVTVHYSVEATDKGHQVNERNSVVELYLILSHLVFIRRKQYKSSDRELWTGQVKRQHLQLA